MKKSILLCFALFPAYAGYGQVYIPIPTDSATWRSRVYDLGPITTVLDFIQFTHGSDSLAGGVAYHKVSGRAFHRIVPSGSVPAIEAATASYPDQVLGAIRENDKKVYLLTPGGEQLLYDFNAVAGNSIPGPGGPIQVTAVDSVLIGSVYHKRFLTTDTSYYVVEGIGSSLGLLPDFIDGGSMQQFMCFTHGADVFTTDATIPCTYIYPIGTTGIAPEPDNASQVNVFFMHAEDAIHIIAGNELIRVGVADITGKIFWQGIINSSAQLSVSDWPRGMYVVYLSNIHGRREVRRIVIQ